MSKEIWDINGSCGIKVALHSLFKNKVQLKRLICCQYVHVSVNISDYPVGTKVFNSFPQSIQN